MVKKILYTFLLFISTGALILMFLTPIYKFNDEKISEYNIEMIATIVDPTLALYRNKADFKSMSKESQEEYKENFKLYNEFALAIIEEDIDKFYEVNKYEVLNNIYKTQLESDGPLNANSTNEEMEIVEKMLIDYLGANQFDSEKKIELYKELSSYKAEIYSLIKSSTNLTKNEDVDDFLINNAINWVADEFLLTFFGYDDELKSITINDYREDGIYLKNFVTAWKNAWAINASIWKDEAYSGLGVFEKIKAVTNDYRFYNPFPLLLISSILLAIVAGLIGLIFKSLQGARGIKYPKAFINSTINGGLTFLLIIASSFISMDYYLSFHYTEYSRLLNLLMYGDFTITLYVVLLAFATGVVVSFLGRFCRWNKTKKD